MSIIIVILFFWGLFALARAIKATLGEKRRQDEAKRIAALNAQRASEAARLRAEWRQQQAEAKEWTRKQIEIERERIRLAAKQEKERKTVSNEDNEAHTAEVSTRIDTNNIPTAGNDNSVELTNPKKDASSSEGESLSSTYKIELSFSIKSSVDNRNPYFVDNQRQLTNEERQFLEDAANELETRVNQLKSFNQIDLSPPSDNDEVVYLPLDGTFNKQFFSRLYLLRYHTVKNEIISVFDMVQYQIPVKVTNIELILLIHGEHLFDGIKLPKEMLKAPIGETCCNNTDEIIKKNHPIASIPFSVWNYRDSDPNRRTAILISDEFKKHSYQYLRIREWIKDIINMAFIEYSYSKQNLVRWVQEYKLFNLVCFWYSDTIFQYTPPWLNGQSLDMFVPNLNLGIEYQGKQHYESVDYFGGDEKLIDNAARDSNKATLCKQNNIKLYQWPYTKKVTFSAVKELLDKDQSDVEAQLLRFAPIPVDNILSKARTYSQLQLEKHAQQRRTTKNHPKSVIRSYDKNGSFVGEYTTIANAADAAGISAASVQKCLAGQRKYSGDLIWRREEWGSDPAGLITQKDEINLDNESGIEKQAKESVLQDSKRPGAKKTVIQVDPSTGEVVNTFESISAAAKAMGISSKGISDVLRGRQKTASGYLWRAYDSDEPL